MWPNTQETTDLVTFTEEIFDGKLHFCAVKYVWTASIEVIFIIIIIIIIIITIIIIFTLTFVFQVSIVKLSTRQAMY